jgi:hypothetical protein
VCLIDSFLLEALWFYLFSSVSVFVDKRTVRFSLSFEFVVLLLLRFTKFYGLIITTKTTKIDIQRTVFKIYDGLYICIYKYIFSYSKVQRYREIHKLHIQNVQKVKQKNFVFKIYDDLNLVSNICTF